MSLAGELTRPAGTPPDAARRHLPIVMDEVEGQGHQIVGSQVTVRIDVEGATDDGARGRGRAGRRRTARSRRCLRKAGAEVTVSRS